MLTPNLYICAAWWHRELEAKVVEHMADMQRPKSSSQNFLAIPQVW
eukprot:CAMPEP_0197553352 /NCGR_PEP_ID=MMETSP1320-20131121/8720_1 /TAXON_ID=91990 /ORGANISM="Bolidomonas sp., Strain RCC2347" /LENGTH=45 /DNA_ID= /DNA_START= /DNA_END= /DNA_ORIENTATION=